MTSQINPNNIDGAYPVAGQDNSSQGFRDNFTNIKNNFTYARNEIDDLQNKALLKAALTGSTLNNNMNNASISDVQLFDVSSPRVASGSVTSVEINYAASPYYTLTTSGSVTLSFINLPPAGQVGTVRLQINVANTAHTLILPAAVSVGTTNIQGYSSSVITFNRTGVYEFEFETSDGGSSISIFDLNRNRDPMYLPSTETVAGNANLSLTVTTSVVTTSADITGNLAAGSDGQIKILAYGNTTTGNCLVTVTNSAWGGSNLANLSAVGSAATFQYINNKWFCVGNNGVAFS